MDHNSKYEQATMVINMLRQQDIFHISKWNKRCQGIKYYLKKVSSDNDGRDSESEARNPIKDLEPKRDKSKLGSHQKDKETLRQ